MLRIVAGAEVEVVISKTRQLVEDLIVFSIVEKIEHRERVLRHTAFHVIAPDHHEAFRLIERKRAKQNGIYNAKDCAIGSCPKHHSEYRNYAECRILAKASKAKSEVVE